MKKLLRFLIIGSLWTGFFGLLCLYFFVWVWKFNFLSPQDRAFLVSFWNNGGMIKSYTDYLFVLSFLICFLLWLLGLRKALKTDYLKLFLKPFDFWRNWEVRHYQSSKHIVLKNIGTTINAKEEEKEFVTNQLKKIEENFNENKKTDKLRDSVKSKLSIRK